MAKEILQALELRSFSPSVTACGRTSSNYFVQLAEEIETYLAAKMLIWKDNHPGVENMKIAVMGCVVNGPGESKMAMTMYLTHYNDDKVSDILEQVRKIVTSTNQLSTKTNKI